jgi:UDP-N-acetylglucosamine--N-acetylmuramyl-(pentapeptide) pyrophosphoryl-undecaprenol N-acetylglucosamine transferase
VGAELERRGWRVSYTGTATGMEASIAASRGLDFHPLEASAVAGRGLFARAAALLLLARSTVRATRLVRSLGARVVVATGGYACVPAAIGAFFARRPVVLVEPNATAGLANRALSRIATSAAVAWPQAARALRCPSRETGVPVRREFFSTPPVPPAGPPWRLLVLGGSQGAAALNESVPAALDRLRRDRGLAVSVVHQAGRGKEDAPRRAYAASGIDAQVVSFLDDVPSAMAASHLVLSRAGAVTLAEICAAGRAAVLFPLALAAGHQIGNAKALERAGAAAVVEAPVETAALAEILARLLDPLLLTGMGQAARSMARPRAAESIADLVQEAVASR